jgi:hypothetical protein
MMPTAGFWKCTIIIVALQTDTEVITYLFDLLIRKHGLTLKDAVFSGCPAFLGKRSSR